MGQCQFQVMFLRFFEEYLGSVLRLPAIVETRWRHIGGGPPASTPAIAGGILFVVDNEHLLGFLGVLLCWGIGVGRTHCLVLRHVKGDGSLRLLVLSTSTTTSTCWSSSMP